MKFFQETSVIKDIHPIPDSVFPAFGNAPGECALLLIILQREGVGNLGSRDNLTEDMDPFWHHCRGPDIVFSTALKGDMTRSKRVFVRFSTGSMPPRRRGGDFC